MAKQSKKERENRRSRKVLLALLLVVFTGIILTASTYAWFTSNKNITIESIDVQVTTANGIQVSTDAINWKTRITNVDLAATLDTGFGYSNTNILPLYNTGNTVTPVSTDLSVTSGKLNMYQGELDISGTNRTLTTTALSNAESAKSNSGQFVAFDLFFLVSQNNSVVKLGRGSTVSASSISGTTNNGLKNAARVAFVPLGTSPVGSVSNAQTSSTLDAAKGVKLWEPNNNVHTSVAVSDALLTYSSLYSASSTPPTGAVQLTTSTELNNYFGVADAFTAFNLSTLTTSYSGNNFASITPDIKSADGGLTADATWYTLDAGITKVRFYLWIEGQDVDCENNASGDTIAFSMNFVLQDNS